MQTSHKCYAANCSRKSPASKCDDTQICVCSPQFSSFLGGSSFSPASIHVQYLLCHSYIWTKLNFDFVKTFSFTNIITFAAISFAYLFTHFAKFLIFHHEIGEPMKSFLADVQWRLFVSTRMYVSLLLQRECYPLPAVVPVAMHCNPSMLSNVNNWRDTERLYAHWTGIFSGIRDRNVRRPEEWNVFFRNPIRTTNNFRIQIDQKLSTSNIREIQHEKLLFKSINYLVWIRMHLEIVEHCCRQERGRSRM